MSDRERLEEEVKKAEAEVARIREENARVADDYRKDPSDNGKELLKRAAISLANARDRVDATKAAVAVFDKTGSLHGLVAGDGRVVGTVVVELRPGISREDRERTIDAALSEKLDEAAKELGVVLAATPIAFTKERPGRDADGKTILEVAGRVEGDRLVPAVSRASKNLRQ